MAAEVWVAAKAVGITVEMGAGMVAEGRAEERVAAKAKAKAAAARAAAARVAAAWGQRARW
jgi:hypothetical protein